MSSDLFDTPAPAEPEKKKRPAFQFYPGDWRKDVQLRACSLAARGLWIDLMCVMHECEPYGHLTINGKPMTPAQASGQIGVPATTVRKLLDELIANGVARQLPDGTIYSKRMVDDERVRNARAAGGSLGAEHGAKGAEHGSKGGRPSATKGGKKTPLPNPQEPPPSSSSSTSASPREGPPASRVPPTASPRATKKAPADFTASAELIAWAAQHAPLVDLQAEIEKLKDHTFATARTDWQGTARNWLRKAQDEAQQRLDRRPRSAATAGADEPAWVRERDDRIAQFAGPAAARRTTTLTDTEAFDAAPPALGQ